MMKVRKKEGYENNNSWHLKMRGDLSPLRHTSSSDGTYRVSFAFYRHLKKLIIWFCV
jgi:hypothetical protein